MPDASALPYSALVLAGRRRRGDDALARTHGADHRALLPVAGVPMLARVLAALSDARRVADVCVSTDAPERIGALPGLAAWRPGVAAALHRSLDSPARSVADALAGLASERVLVTTADHALLTAARVDRFLDAADATGADVAVGVVERGAGGEAGERTWIRLRGGAYTGANLFALRTPRARHAVATLERAERERKRPWRLFAALAPGLGAAYLTGRLDLDGAFARVSRHAGARLRPVSLDDAEAALDVDKASDLALAERLLVRRAAEAASDSG